MSDTPSPAVLAERLDTHIESDTALHAEIRADLKTLVAERNYVKGGFAVSFFLLTLILGAVVSAHPRFTFAPTAGQTSPHTVTASHP